MPRPRAPARMPLVSRCTTAPVTRTAPMPIPPTEPATASTLALIGDSAGGTSTTHTCTCNDGYFGDGDTAGTGCTTCTAVANSINVTCTSATNSCAVYVTGSILVPAATTSTTDLCRLECPFVDLLDGHGRRPQPDLPHTGRRG
jgi:hypothetical protein